MERGHNKCARGEEQENHGAGGFPSNVHEGGKESEECGCLQNETMDDIGIAVQIEVSFRLAESFCEEGRRAQGWAMVARQKHEQRLRHTTSARPIVSARSRPSITSTNCCSIKPQKFAPELGAHRTKWESGVQDYATWNHTDQHHGNAP